LNITRLAAKLPERPAAVIITSSQAIAGLPERYARLPVFCVGDATAGRLRQRGFSRVESAGGDAADLFRLVTARRVPGQHVLASGARQGVRLARQLRDAGVDVLRRSVYSARPVGALPAAVTAMLAGGRIDAALFYSAETGRAFARLAPPGTKDVTALALSWSVAKAVNGLPWAQIRVALAPAEADLLALL
jgi:uroporphyrinogen-III synthase